MSIQLTSMETTTREPTNTDVISEMLEGWTKLAREKGWQVCADQYEDHAFVTAWAPVDGVNWCRLIRYRNGIKVFHDTKLGDPVAITAAEAKALEAFKLYTW